MPSFSSDGVEIAYDVTGDGEPILLIHGFASNARVNWGETGWVKLLSTAGRQVITVDNRGHGASAKLYDPALYTPQHMAGDGLALLDHLGLAQADVLGYSMGARVAAVMALTAPERVRSVILGGLAANMIRGVGGSQEIAAALEADTLEGVADPQARGFRAFAEQTKSDRAALAACIRSSRTELTAEELAGIRVPVLVVAGDADDIAGPVGPLVEVIAHAEGVTLKDRDHMKAVGDRVYKDGVLAFLARRP